MLKVFEPTIHISLLDSSSNGLTYLVEKFRNEEIAGHITLTRGKRSIVAELGAKLL